MGVEADREAYAADLVTFTFSLVVLFKTVITLEIKVKTRESYEAYPLRAHPATPLQ